MRKGWAKDFLIVGTCFAHDRRENRFEAIARNIIRIIRAACARKLGSYKRFAMCLVSMCYIGVMLVTKMEWVMKQVFLKDGVVICQIDSEDNRAKDDIIEDLPSIDFKVKIREIEYRDSALYIKCSKHPVGFRLHRVS